MSAIISVHDAKSVIPLARALADAGVEIICTQDTGKVIREAGLSCSITREPLRRLYTNIFDFVIVGFSDNVATIDEDDADRCSLLVAVAPKWSSMVIVADPSEYRNIIAELGVSGVAISNSTKRHLASKALGIIVSHWASHVARSLRQQV